VDVEKLVAIKFLVEESHKRNLINKAVVIVGVLESYTPELLRTLTNNQGDRIIAYLNKANMTWDIEHPLRKRKRVHR
jgi:hypothetical protein